MRFQAQLTDSAAADSADVDISPAALSALIASGERLTSSHALDDALPQPAALDLLIEVTHDLRSPLSSMLVLIENLRSGRLGPLNRQQETQLGLLYEATFEVSNLTQNALGLARRPAVSVPVPGVPFSMAEMWLGVRSLIAPMAQERGLMVRWAAPRADRRWGHADGLQKVLLNLVTNAIKCTPRGVVSVTAEEHSGDHVRFRVTDTGTGLSEPARSLIGELTAEGAVPGTRMGGSLGLAICAHLLRAMGSRLTIGLHEGPGTCLEFDLMLPVVQGSNPGSGPQDTDRALP